MVTTAALLQKNREAGCTSITHDRKYYQVGETFVKRSLRTKEWQMGLSGFVAVPRLASERLQNEAATLKFLSANTSIPLPRLLCCFEDDGAVYLITEKVQGVELADLSQDEQAVVLKELRGYVEILHSLKSKRIGPTDPTIPVIPPHRFLRKALRLDWVFPESETEEYVFCHGDLSRTNIMVDPESLKIKAILDWEYSGYFPEAFDFPYFESQLPSGQVDVGQDYLDMVSTFFMKKSH